jgi:acyl carrier protein
MTDVDSRKSALGATGDDQSARRVVFGALTDVIPAGQRPAELDDQLELYADLGMDSLRFVRLLIELESKLGISLTDEELLTVDLVTVGDLVALVGRITT